jgi:hypothetical protein
MRAKAKVKRPPAMPTTKARSRPKAAPKAKARRGFSNDVLTRLRDGSYIKIRAGTEDHRFIGIWLVVVEGRVFVRSWSMKPRSWWRTFLEDPRGAVELDGRELPVRAVQTKSVRLKDAIDEAYLKKYNTRAGIKYARDLGREKSRATTTELVPR